MMHGYTLPDPSDDPDSWDDFEWSIPETYNIASVALDHDPHRTALRHVDLDGDRHEFTYDELDRAADVLVAHLHAEGVEAGDRVAVCLPQCPEQLVVHLASYRVGALVVPLSMLLGQDAFQYQIAHADVDVLFLDSTRLDELADEVTGPADTVVTVDLETTGYSGPRRALGGLSAVTDSSARPPATSTSHDDPAVILYTSGTSGHPKGVLQSHGYLLGSLPGYHCAYQLFTEEDCSEALLWTPSEWAWAGALFDVVFPTLAVGGTVLSTERRSGFDPSGALGHIERESVSHVFLPPTALARMRAESSPTEYDVSSLQVVMSGGEKLLPAIFEWGERVLDVAVNESYGQTEANMLVGNCRRMFDAKPGSMGKSYPGHEVVIVDENGDRQPPGELGEIVVETPDPVTLLEYWDDPEATSEKFLDDGRMRTGDLGWRDEDGFLWHAGRSDDLIITSGYRVSPLEVESVLMADHRVDAAVVGGVSDTERGERVKACLQLANGHEPSEKLAEEFRSHVRERLGAHKSPHDIEFIESIPETHSGKTDRAALFSD